MVILLPPAADCYDRRSNSGVGRRSARTDYSAVVVILAACCCAFHTAQLLKEDSSSCLAMGRAGTYWRVRMEHCAELDSAS